MNKEWHGCPHCSSSDYETYQEEDGEILRIWFFCRNCRREFFTPPLLYWIPCTIEKKGDRDQNNEDLQEISYNPVPPKRTFTVRARYQFKGRIEPQPYQPDGEWLT